MSDTRPYRILGIDLGTVRVGIAISDELLMTAQPLCVVQRQPQKRFLEKIKEIVDTNNVTEIVVGLPLSLNGSPTDSTADARGFAARLEKRFPDVKIALWDERLTTTASESLLVDAGVRRDKRREVIDKIAAALILESYLHYRQTKTAPERPE